MTGVFYMEHFSYDYSALLYITQVIMVNIEQFK